MGLSRKNTVQRHTFCFIWGIVAIKYLKRSSTLFKIRGYLQLLEAITESSLIAGLAPNSRTHTPIDIFNLLATSIVQWGGVTTGVVCHWGWYWGWSATDAPGLSVLYGTRGEVRMNHR